jgi:hypothetical protein
MNKRNKQNKRNQQKSQKQHSSQPIVNATLYNRDQIFDYCTDWNNYLMSIDNQAEAEQAMITAYWLIDCTAHEFNCFCMDAIIWEQSHPIELARFEAYRNLPVQMALIA